IGPAIVEAQRLALGGTDGELYFGRAVVGDGPTLAAAVFEIPGEPREGARIVGRAGNWFRAGVSVGTFHDGDIVEVDCAVVPGSVADHYDEQVPELDVGRPLHRYRDRVLEQAVAHGLAAFVRNFDALQLVPPARRILQDRVDLKILRYRFAGFEIHVHGN